MSTAASKCSPFLHFVNDANGADTLVTNEASNTTNAPLQCSAKFSGETSIGHLLILKLVS